MQSSLKCQTVVSWIQHWEEQHKEATLEKQSWGLSWLLVTTWYDPKSPSFHKYNIVVSNMQMGSKSRSYLNISMTGLSLCLSLHLCKEFQGNKKVAHHEMDRCSTESLIQRSGACQILSICRFLWDLWHLWLGQHRSLALEVERVCAFAKELPDGPGLMDSFAWSVFMKTFIRFGDTVIDGDRVEFYGILPF